MTRLLGLWCIGATASAFGQPSVPKNNRYDVVSIKPGIKGQPPGFHTSPSQLRLDNYALPEMVSVLLGVPLDRVVGLPAWTSSETFSFRAKSIVATNNPAEQWAMLLPVLQDRFRLKYHLEKRHAHVYELSAEPGGIRLPVAVPGSCKPISPDDGAPTGAQGASKALAEPEPPHSCGRFLFRILPKGGFELSVKAITTGNLAASLQRFVGRPVVDRSGLPTLYDIESMKFASDAGSFGTGSLRGDMHSQAAAANAEAAREAGVPNELPSIFEALRKMGLRLTSGQGAVDVVVIDRLESPSEN